MCALKEWSFYFPESSGTPEIEPCWNSKPKILGIHLPIVGPLGWGARYEAQIPHSLGRISSVVIIIPFVSCPHEGMGLDYIMTLLILPVSLWFLLYIFSCRRYFLIFFIDGCSITTCNFGVPVRGGELRVFLLCHLGRYPGMKFLEITTDLDGDYQAIHIVSGFLVN